MISQNDTEYLIDMVNRGEMTPDEANVQKVRMGRVLVVSKLPSDVRRALNNAVKAGILCRKKKERFKPEVYYHPDFEHLANAVRNEAWITIDQLHGYYQCPKCGNDYYNEDDEPDSLGSCPHCGAWLDPPEVVNER